MKIMPNRMDRGFEQYQKEFEDKALEVLRSGWYILGFFFGTGYSISRDVAEE